MRLFLTPTWVQQLIRQYGQPGAVPAEKIDELRAGLQRFIVPDPEVSIVIPAYNEEEALLRTLASLANLKTTYRTELIVANNKSTDRTQALLDQCGVQSVFVAEQGIGYARQGGLMRARGRFIVSADADSLYPPTWLDALVTPLQQPDVACTYGMYSFIPGQNTSRLALGLHELSAETFKQIKRKNREFVDVMGFNFAFRKADAVAVGGFRCDFNRYVTSKCEDGWMAYSLLEKGKLKRVDSARVWTSDRRLLAEGSLGNAYLFRVRKELKRLSLYV